MKNSELSRYIEIITGRYKRGNLHLTLLERHFWAHRFSKWLKDNALKCEYVEWSRAGGMSQAAFFGKAQSRERSTIVFLHGLGNDAIFPNMGFFRYLLGAGYNIVTCDIDGHGKSLTSVFSKNDIKSLTSDLIRICDHFVVGRPRLHLCGYSFGAALMLDYAVHNPERVRSLSLIGMPSQLSKKIGFIAEVMTPVVKSYRLAVKEYGPIGILPAVGPFLRSHYPIRMEQNSGQSYLDLAKEVIDEIDPIQKLEIVTFPTLVIFGSKDYICGLTSKEVELRKSNVQVFKLKGETHFSSMLAQKTARRIEVLLRSAP